MRHFLIDTDTAGDDAVALIMLLRAEDICVDAITTVAGNVPVEQSPKTRLRPSRSPVAVPRRYFRVPTGRFSVRWTE